IPFRRRASLAIAAVVAIAATLWFVRARNQGTTDHIDDDKLIASWIELGDSSDAIDVDSLEIDDLDLETESDMPSWMISAMEERNR
ncbi:MAG: hypothetical protein KDB80_14870, partial [Planctomycetes bacterium]|nr:hypothetical protein [Planctomycetota bacterium]